MIRSGLCLLVFLLIGSTLWAQSEIFISDENKDISKIDIEANNCDKTVIVRTSSSLSDITLHPDGNMYGCNFSTRKIFRVNMTTGALTELTTITEASRLVGMTADSDGLIYVTEGDVVPSRLFVYDPVANTYESRGWLAEGSAGDLTWYFGNLYNASDNNKLVKVDINDAANSVVVAPFTGVVKAGDRIFALVTVIENCDNSATYGLSEKGDYYRIDMSTAIVDRLCVDNVDLYGSTSADEFNASECFLTLDLDKDDSSGATGSDFESDFSCQPSATALIADSDVEIEVANLVDSVTIEIIGGILNGNDEFLSVGSATNINTNNLAQKLVGVSNGSASTFNFESYLSSMRYNNTAFPVIEGDRSVRVIGYSEGRSDTGFVTITIVDNVVAGNDGLISFCSTDAPADLFNSLGGSPDVGGTWTPTLASNSGVFDPSIDPPGDYIYTVTDGCFKDSAKVTVSVASSATFDLGNDTTICFGSSLSLDAYVGTPSATYNWSNGSTDSVIVVTSSGNYSVTVDFGSCQVSDDIDVTFVNFQLDLGNDVSICPGDSILIGDDIGEAGATYLWNTGETTAEIYASTTGNYSVEVSFQGCEKTDNINVMTSSVTSIDLGNDTTICFGNSFSLNAGIGNPSATFLWNNGATDSVIDVTASGNYSVVVNFGSCQVSDDIDVTFVNFQLDLGNDVSICPGDSILIGDDIGEAGATYLWNTGASTAEIYASTVGNFSVEVSYQGCTQTDNISVTAASGTTISVDLGPDTTICPGNDLILSSGYSTTAYDHLWNNGSTASSITVTTPGTYYVTLNSGCQTGSDTIVVALAPTTTIPLDLGPDITFCEGETISLTTSYTAPEYSHLWSTGSTAETIVVADSGLYSLTVTGNCEIGTDSILVMTIDCDTIPIDSTTDTTIIPIDTTTEFYYCEILMPTAFTPNGDNSNDEFGPVNVCEGFLSYELYVYNRYGELVFKGSDTTWDGTFKGKEAPMDNFIWYAIYFYENDKIVTERGNIILLR